MDDYSNEHVINDWVNWLSELIQQWTIMPSNMLSMIEGIDWVNWFSSGRLCQWTCYQWLSELIEWIDSALDDYANEPVINVWVNWLSELIPQWTIMPTNMLSMIQWINRVNWFSSGRLCQRTYYQWFSELIEWIDSAVDDYANEHVINDRVNWWVNWFSSGWLCQRTCYQWLSELIEWIDSAVDDYANEYVINDWVNCLSELIQQWMIMPTNMLSMIVWMIHQWTIMPTNMLSMIECIDSAVDDYANEHVINDWVNWLSELIQQ